MKNLKNFYYPESIEEALETLREEPEKTAIVAGGSSVSLSKNERTESLVDITRLGLDHIKDEKGYLAIGATVSIQKIYKSGAVRSTADGMISEAALNIASRPLRNAITLGGNIAGLRVWSDMPTVLLALDASIKVKGRSENLFSAVDFFKSHPSKLLGNDSIVTEVVFPKTVENSGGHYIKFSKTKGDYAIITVACYVEIEEGVCSLARIAVGSVANLPARMTKAETLLEGKPIDEELIKKAAEESRNEIKPVSNIWGSAEYKSELVEALVERALSECVKKARSKN